MCNNVTYKQNKAIFCAGCLQCLSSVHSSIRLTRFPILVKVKIIVSARRTWEVNTTAMDSHHHQSSDQLHVLRDVYVSCWPEGQVR